LAFIPNSIVTLTTDFGQDDPFAGAMKGVILSVNPNARIVDITHGVPAHDVLAGALALHASCSYFPKGTIHLAVVDPGVGSQRRPLLAISDDHAFVGPDNGLLARTMELQQNLRVFHLTEESYFHKPVSQTFHGRDIFAPAAAWLSLGTPPESFGSVIDDWIRLDWPAPRQVGRSLFGTVLRVDQFGNLITNVAAEDLVSPTMTPQAIKIIVRGRTIQTFCRSYAEAASAEPFGIIGSAGLLEISVKQASASALLGVGALEVFEIRFSDEIGMV
jgi:S-adenosyl-L-methionine hydrolase (adenosine-forming)